MFKLTSGWAHVGLSKERYINDFKANHIEGCNVLLKYGMKAKLHEAKPNGEFDGSHSN